LDEPTQSVVMHRTEPSRLQSMSLQLADKLSNLVDNNERILKIRQGNHSFLSALIFIQINILGWVVT